MALEVAHGTIEWLTSTTAGNTYVVSSLSFQPKAIMFWWVGLASGGADALSSTVDQRRGVGFATSTSARRAVASYDDNGASTSDCSTVAADDCIACTLDNTGARNAELDITAFASNGFTLTVDDQLETNNITVFWIAWGGADITVAAVGDFAAPAAAGDVNEAVTGFTSNGLNQVVLVASVQSTAAINTSLVENGGMSIGFATGTGATEQCTVAGSDDHGSALPDTDGFGRAGVVQAQCAVAGGTAWITGALSAWGTDQFTITYAGTTHVSGRKSIYLAMKGGAWKAGGYAIDGNTGSATATVSSLPFVPKGVAIIGRMTAEQSGTTGSAEDRIGIGVGTSTSSRRSQGILNKNATADLVTVGTTAQFDQVLSFVNEAGALVSAYDINAMNSDGFQIIVDTAGGVASEWQGYLAFGDTPVPQGAASFSGAGVLVANGYVPITYVSFAEFEIPSVGGTAWQGEAAFVGAGALVTVGGLQFAGRASFAGAGALTSRGDLRLPAQTSFAGAGVFTAQSVLQLDGRSSFAGVGGLLTSSYALFDARTVFAGAGAFIADAARLGAQQGEVVFAGVGALTADSYLLLNGQIVFAGAGAFAADATTTGIQQGEAAFAGVGAFTSRGDLQLPVQASFTGAGTLTVGSFLLLDARASFSGVGTLSASLRQSLAARATFAGGGTLFANATVGAPLAYVSFAEFELPSLGTTWQGEASFAGSGAFSARAGLVSPIAASFAGVGAFSSTAYPLLDSRAVFAGAGALASTAYLLLDGRAAFAGAGSLVSEATIPFAIHQGAASFTGVGSFLALHLPATRLGQFGIGVASYDWFSAKELQPTLAETLFAGAGEFVASPFVLLDDRVALTGVGTLVATSVALRDGRTVFAGAGALVSQSAVLFDGRATFVGTGAFVTDSFILMPGFALTGVGAFVADAVAVRIGLVEFAGAGLFVAPLEQRFIAEAVFAGTGVLVADVATAFVWQGETSFAGTGALFAEGTGAATWYGEAVFAGAGTLTARSQSQNTVSLIYKLLANRQELNPVDGTFTVYDDDSVTPLLHADAWADTNGTVPYTGPVLRRIDRLVP